MSWTWNAPIRPSPCGLSSQTSGSGIPCQNGQRDVLPPLTVRLRHPACHSPGQHPIKTIHNRGKIDLSGRDGESVMSVSHFSFGFSVWKSLFTAFGTEGFPPALAPDHKSIFRHDPAHHLFGDDGSLAADQGMYPAIPITPVVFMEKNGDPFTYAGILVLFFEGSFLIIITAFWQFEPF